MKTLFLLMLMLTQIEAKPIPHIKSVRQPRTAVASPWVVDFSANVVREAIVAPHAAVQVNAIAGSYTAGTVKTYRIYAFRYIRGVQYFSANYLQLTLISSGGGLSGCSISPFYISSTTATQPDGYRFLQQSNEPGHETNFDVYRDGEGITDTSWTEWAPGNTVTPAQNCTLVDLSGNARDATGTNVELVSNGWFDGSPCLRFNGTSDYLETADFASQGNGITVLMAARLRELRDFQYLFDGKAGNRLTVLAVGQGLPVIQKWTFNQGGSLGYGSAQSTNPTLICARFAGDGTTNLRIDGTTVGTANVGAHALAKVRLGSAAGGGGFASMDFKALRVWPRVLSLAETVVAEDEFAGNYVTFAAVQRKAEDNTTRLTETDEPRILQ